MLDFAAIGHASSMSANDGDAERTPLPGLGLRSPDTNLNRYMIKSCVTLRIGLSLVLLSLGVRVSAEPGHIPGKYIVLLNAGVVPETVAGGHGVAPDFVYRTAVNGFAGTIPPGQLRALQNDPRVSAVVQDNVVYAFAKPGGGGTSTGEVIPEGVKRIEAAPGTVPFNGSGIGVAVVDTGVDLAHADLKPVVDAFSSFGGTAQDDNGHGTHVSGIIAARINGADVVGVAPAAQIYAVKVLDASGSGSDASVIAGLEYVTAHANNIRVVNMSLGRPASSNPSDDNPMHVAIQNVVNAGVTVVVAAGNDCSLAISDQVPSGFPEVIAVASTTAKDGTKNRFGYGISRDTASYFTSDGDGVGISAPGEDQENVSNGYLLSSVGILSTKLGGGTTRMSGTSMASPHVAGVAALIYQQAGGLISPSSVRSKIAASGVGTVGIAPLDSPTSCYSFDSVREGVLSAKKALGY